MTKFGLQYFQFYHKLVLTPAYARLKKRNNTRNKIQKQHMIKKNNKNPYTNSGSCSNTQIQSTTKTNPTPLNLKMSNEIKSHGFQ